MLSVLPCSVLWNEILQVLSRSYIVFKFISKYFLLLTYNQIAEYALSNINNHVFEFTMMYFLLSMYLLYVSVAWEILKLMILKTFFKETSKLIPSIYFDSLSACHVNNACYVNNTASNGRDGTWYKSARPHK